MADRKILACYCYQTGWGTHHYDVKFTGEWKDEELINAIDNKVFDNPTKEDLFCSNYGGYVERLYEKDGITRANVGVFYD